MSTRYHLIWLTLLLSKTAVVYSQPPSSNVTLSLRPPASSFIDCAALVNVSAVYRAFDTYHALYPEVSLEIVNGPLGRPFRKALMVCGPRVCLLPYGSWDSDILGIGVSYLLYNFVGSWIYAYLIFIVYHIIRVTIISIPILSNPCFAMVD
jgi:hypothetical protein